jgi:hypothetical protein
MRRRKAQRGEHWILGEHVDVGSQSSRIEAAALEVLVDVVVIRDCALARKESPLGLVDIEHGQVAEECEEYDERREKPPPPTGGGRIGVHHKIVAQPRGCG